MQRREAERRGNGPLVALLTFVWVLAVLALVWRIFGLGLTAWAAEQSDGGLRAAELRHQAAVAQTLLAVVAAGGPALIAVVAFATGMARTGGVYAVLAVLIGGFVLVAVAEAHRDRLPSAPPSPGPVVCQEHSGGDNRCPGG